MTFMGETDETSVTHWEGFYFHSIYKDCILASANSIYWQRVDVITHTFYWKICPLLCVKKHEL